MRTPMLVGTTSAYLQFFFSSIVMFCNPWLKHREAGNASEKSRGIPGGGCEFVPSPSGFGSGNRLQQGENFAGAERLRGSGLAKGGAGC